MDPCCAMYQRSSLLVLGGSVKYSVRVPGVKRINWVLIGNPFKHDLVVGKRSRCSVRWSLVSKNCDDLMHATSRLLCLHTANDF